MASALWGTERIIGCDIQSCSQTCAFKQRWKYELSQPVLTAPGIIRAAVIELH
jgi:hypothetical protein